MRAFFKDLFFRLAPKGLPTDRASILMYHSVSDSDSFSSVPLRSFESQMAHLAKTKRPVISLAELVTRLKEKKPLSGSIVITFDDGYRDNYTNAFPILKRYGFPATIFMVTDLIGRTGERGMTYLSLQELKEMAVSGIVSVEPHSKSHPKLSTLSAPQAREEIEGSKKTLEGLLGKSARTFAYPYGNFNDETVNIVKEADFKAAVSVKEGTVRANADLFRLKRNSIDNSTTLAQFKGKISRAVDIYEGLKI